MQYIGIMYVSIYTCICIYLNIRNNIKIDSVYQLNFNLLDKVISHAHVKLHLVCISTMNSENFEFFVFVLIENKRMKTYTLNYC